MTRREAYLLPYQAAWVRDESRFKIVEKSRRIGFTYAQSYEDARDAALSPADGGMDVWMSSADESAAEEYIRYVGRWAEILGLAAQDLGEIVIDRKHDIKARSVEFASGHRVNGLSSNPKGFRSKGGKLVLDEFAFHQDQDAMWKAAQPIVLWGFPVRILSTHNGKAVRYFRMVRDAKKAGSIWSLHRITVEDAVHQGLADRIQRRALTEAERQAWIDEAHAAADDEDTWQQEYMCNPVDSQLAWLPWELITSAEHASAGIPELYQGGRCYVGMDIARRRDLTVIWAIELVGDIYWTREVVRLQGRRFAEQLEVFDQVMARYRADRACLDQTGMGEPLVEAAKDTHGDYKVEGVLFTGPTKQAIAVDLKRLFEDRRTRIPEDRQTRNQHHAVQKEITAAGNVRFDADRTVEGHADEFWAHGLAVHAAGVNGPPPADAGAQDVDREAYVPSRMRGRLRSILGGRSWFRA